MKLFILRHGMTAESDADERRELSEKGIKEVEDVMNLRRDDLRSVTRIYSSPMRRVKQTLQIAAKIMAFQGPIIESQYLMTGSRLNEIINFMGELDLDAGDILVSSHQSCTSILVLWLTGEDILIPNGSLLAIDIEKPVQGGGKILWQQSRDSSEVKRAVDFVDQF
ncbi:MAG: histidine phosphatase family protein [Gammaproteobacteria bacterium]|nr:histidine phosphatase family protein [Gammaproteobacteria bacterium]